MATTIIAGSGTLKGVYIQGAFSYLEQRGLRAERYLSASSSVLSSLYAATGKSNELGLQYWKDTAIAVGETGDMTTIVKRSIEDNFHLFEHLLQMGNAKPYFGVAVTKIISEEAQRAVRADNANKLGRKLLVELARGNSDWVDNNAQATLFTTEFATNHHPIYALHLTNFKEVAYASTRMLHAWKQPAFIDDEDYIDASYSAAVPVQFANLETDDTIIIDINHDSSYESLRRKIIVDTLAKKYKNTTLIKPSQDLEELGVHFMKASQQGIINAYELGFYDAKKCLKFNI